MNKSISLVLGFIFLCSAAFATASVDGSDLQDQLKAEYGNCYDSFPDNLLSCTRSTCTYPDLTTAKSWKTKVINGMVNNRCYVMYYSFMGQSITSDPDHCFYDKNTLTELYSNYKKLFKTASAVDMMTLKGKIHDLSYQGCKKGSEKDQ